MLHSKSRIHFGANYLYGSLWFSPIVGNEGHVVLLLLSHCIISFHPMIVIAPREALGGYSCMMKVKGGAPTVHDVGSCMKFDVTLSCCSIASSI